MAERIPPLAALSRNDKRGGIAHIITTNIAKFKTDFAAQSYANLVNATGEYYEVLEKDVV